MRRRNILIGTLALAVVVATIGGVAYALHTRAQVHTDGKSYPGLHAPVSVVCPGPTYTTTGLGRPYRATGQGGTGIRARNDCTPSFTQQDVRDYLARGVSLGMIGVTGQPTVTRVVFLTIGDLDRASGDSEWEANYPADMLVCYAGLSGTFTFSSGIDPPSSLSAVSIVFDAHTGNQLVIVAGPLLG
jgi:hypothetical protein